jgi:hypothetical protein
MTNCLDPQTLTPEELVSLYKLMPEFRDWINAVEKEAMKLAVDNKLPGYKIVAGRSLRKWKDQDTAETNMQAAGFTGDELYTRSFVSVAQAEKLLGKALFRKIEGELVYRTEGRPVIAPLSDKRAAINAAAEFKPVDPKES